MRCPFCGRELREDDRFCPSCGKPVDRAGTGTEKPSAPEVPDKPENEKPRAGIPDPRARNDYVPTPENQPGTFPGEGPSPAGGGSGRSAGSRIGIAVKAVAAVVLYIFLFVGVQSCVIGNYMAANMDTGALVIAAQNAADDPEALSQALNEVLAKAIDLVYDKQTLLLLIANLVAVLVVCLLFRLRRRRPTEEFALYPVNPRRLLQFALFGVALNVTLAVGIGLLPLPESLLEAQEAQYAGLLEGSLLLSLFSVGIVGPATEEIFFRGISMTRLGPALGSAAAAIVSALFFGLAHVTPLAVGYAFLIGLILAAVYLKYGSILPGIVCHCFFNMTSFWLGNAEGTVWEIALVAVSVLILGWTWYSAVIRYPRFDDVLYDSGGRIRVKDPEKQAIIEECRRIRTHGGVDLGEIRALAERWDKSNRKK